MHNLRLPSAASGDILEAFPAGRTHVRARCSLFPCSLVPLFPLFPRFAFHPLCSLSPTSSNHGTSCSVNAPFFWDLVLALHCVTPCFLLSLCYAMRHRLAFSLMFSIAEPSAACTQENNAGTPEKRPWQFPKTEVIGQNTKHKTQKNIAEAVQ